METNFVHTLRVWEKKLSNLDNFSPENFETTKYLSWWECPLNDLLTCLPRNDIPVFKVQNQLSIVLVPLIDLIRLQPSQARSTNIYDLRVPFVHFWLVVLRDVHTPVSHLAILLLKLISFC